VGLYVGNEGGAGGGGGPYVGLSVGVFVGLYVGNEGGAGGGGGILSANDVLNMQQNKAHVTRNQKILCFGMIPYIF